MREDGVVVRLSSGNGSHFMQSKVVFPEDNFQTGVATLNQLLLMDLSTKTLFVDVISVKGSHVLATGHSSVDMLNETSSTRILLVNSDGDIGFIEVVKGHHMIPDSPAVSKKNFQVNYYLNFLTPSFPNFLRIAFDPAIQYRYI
jgi:hypothetical protein